MLKNDNTVSAANKYTGNRETEKQKQIILDNREFTKVEGEGGYLLRLFERYMLRVYAERVFAAQNLGITGEFRS